MSVTRLRSSAPEGDLTLLGVTLVLAGVGLAFVLSASQALAYLEHRWPLYYFARQLGADVVGLVAMFALMRIDIEFIRRHARTAAAVAGALMIVVLLPHVGIEANGARRWFNLGPLGTFQPSELGKLCFALYLADWVDRRGERLNSLTDGLLPFALMLVLAIGVLMLEKDLGTAIITAAIFVAIYFAGGGRARHLFLLAAALILAFALVTVLTPYRNQRLGAFLDPFRDPLNTGFQSTQALLALGSGGVTGVGLGKSVQKFLWLPEAHTDFIFAIVGEETGLIGTTGVLVAFLLFAWRGFRAALRAPDRYCVIVAAGLTTWITVQALVNMGTVTNTTPATGVPLPFISYGGTSMVVLLAAVGILLNIAGRGRDQSFRRIDATLDSGRRDGGTSVPGPRRRAGVPR